MKQYLLTDFSSERWKGVDLESVKECLKNVEERANNGRLLGELENPDRFDISLNNCTHSITNVVLKNDKIYGDIEFLSNGKGQIAKDLVENHNCKFGIRSTGNTSEGVITIEQIFTWDLISNEL
jgi:hypothetical protein